MQRALRVREVVRGDGRFRSRMPLAGDEFRASVSEFYEPVYEMGDGGRHHHHLAHAHSVHASPFRVAQAIEDHACSDRQRCS